MADSTLTKEHGLALLHKLAHDDAFRSHFEQKPAEALLNLGVPADLICRLPGKCLCHGKLAPKEEMEAARTRLSGDQDLHMLAFFIPSPRVNS